MPQAEPFTVAVPDEAIEDLHRRIDNTRFPADFANEDWRFGMNREYLESFLHTWRHEYDWRDTEARINAFNNYQVLSKACPWHFIHEREVAPPHPLFIPHPGWPWTFLGLREGHPPAPTDPAAYGGRPRLTPFDIRLCTGSVPALQGFSTTPSLRSASRQQGRRPWPRLND